MKRTILVVDDMATQRKTAFYTLSGAGYEVLQAENGKVALNLLKQNRPMVDLVLADYTMPTMDGLSLLKQLQSDASLQAIPVLFLLMESQIHKQDELRQAGAVGWILKPYEPEQLCSVVRKIIP